MKSAVIRNILMLVVLVTIFVGYFAKLANTVPQDWMLMVNFVLVPLPMGAIAYIAFVGKRLTRLMLVSAIPILSVIFVGGDPAKPGLQYLLIAPLLVVMLIGASASLVLQWHLCKRKMKPTQ